MWLIDRLTNFVSGLGTGKDKATHSAFMMPVLSPAELHAMHRSDWLARKIVDIIPHDMTREWRAWQADDAEVEQIEEAERALGLQQKVTEAMQRARLLGGSGIFIGTGQRDTESELRPDAIKAGGIAYLHVLSREEITAGDTVRDVQSPFYGRPSYYQLSSIGTQVRIHPSRVIPFIGAPIFDRLTTAADPWGDSVLQVVYDAVQNAASSQQHIASLISEAKLDIIKVPGLSDALSTPEGTKTLTQRFTLANTLKSTINALLLEGDGQTGETWEQKTINFAQFPELMRLFLQVAAGAADIPVTRLLGQSPSGLNATGDGDIRNYYDNVASRQEVELRPVLAPLDEMLIRHALGSRPAEVHYAWSPLWQLDEVQKADIAAKKAATTKVYYDTGLIPLDALAKAAVNQLIEDSVYPGLEAAIAESPEEPGDSAQTAEERAAAEQMATARAAGGGQQQAADAAPRTLYVSRKVKNAAAILKWARAQGFETTLAAADLHVTIAFSREPVDWMAVGESWSPELKIAAGGPRLMERFGDATVLLFTANELRWRHEAIKEAGASWDHPEYQPHITISYDDRRPLDEIEPYQGEIVLGPEIFAEVDADWQAKIMDGGGPNADRPFVDAFNPLQPRDPNGRWIDAGARLLAALGLAGQNAAVHVQFADVRRPASLGKMVGIDVRGFQHAASNQAMRHTLLEHGNPAIEAARGQKAITAADFARMPEIVRTGQYAPAKARKFGPPRVEIRATVGGERYFYVAEVRRGKRRLDMISMWKR
jgi:phage-related protein (TIGR01555 family)